MADVPGYHASLLPMMQEARKLMTEPRHTAGQVARLKRLSSAIHSTEGASEGLKYTAKAIDKYVTAKSRWMHEGGIEDARRAKDHLRSTFDTFANKRDTYKVAKEPDFKAKGAKLEKRGASAYDELSSEYSKIPRGGMYAKLLTKNKSSFTKVNSDDLDERRELDNRHRKEAARHRAYAKGDRTPIGKAHKKAASFHEGASKHLRAQVLHEASKKADANRPVMTGKRGGRYIVTSSGKKWYIGRGGAD